MLRHHGKITILYFLHTCPIHTPVGTFERTRKGCLRKCGFLDRQYWPSSVEVVSQLLWLAFYRLFRRKENKWAATKHPYSRHCDARSWQASFMWRRHFSNRRPCETWRFSEDRKQGAWIYLTAHTTSTDRLTDKLKIFARKDYGKPR